MVVPSLYASIVYKRRDHQWPIPPATGHPSSQFATTKFFAPSENVDLRFGGSGFAHRITIEDFKAV